MNDTTASIADEDLRVSHFDPITFLNSEDAIAAYIEAVFEENDTALLMTALRHVVKARGVSVVAKAAGVGRESLYKTLAPGSSPRLETVLKLLTALGLRMKITSAKKAVEEQS